MSGLVELAGRYSTVSKRSVAGVAHVDDPVYVDPYTQGKAGAAALAGGGVLAATRVPELMSDYRTHQMIPPSDPGRRAMRAAGRRHAAQLLAGAALAGVGAEHLKRANRKHREGRRR